MKQWRWCKLRYYTFEEWRFDRRSGHDKQVEITENRGGRLKRPSAMPWLYYLIYWFQQRAHFTQKSKNKFRQQSGFTDPMNFFSFIKCKI